MECLTTFQERVVVVLHRTQYARNLGQCARAMSNLGLRRLILVNCLCDISSLEARQGAAHAQDILGAASVYHNLTSFEQSEGNGLRIALTARSRRHESLLELGQALDEATERFPRYLNDDRFLIYLHFGPEDDGLSSDEIQGANLLCSLPLRGSNRSLNLSHAVLLAGYIISSHIFELAAKESAPSAPIESSSRYDISDSIRTWMQSLGVNLDRHRTNLEKRVARFIRSADLKNTELRLLEIALQQTIRKLKSNSMNRKLDTDL